MGCDIHTHAEKRVNGRWEAVMEPVWEEGDDEATLPKSARITGGRDYFLFSLLSGVRGELGVQIIKPAFECVPADASPEVQSEYARQEGDAHTPGCVTWQALSDAKKDIDVKVLVGQLDPSLRESIEELMDNFQRAADEHTLNVREMRVVLWYDN